MTTAAPIVEIAFATTPFVTPTWVDVTAKVVGGTVTRGRTSELDKIRAGTATITLANEDRRFDPTHTTGPYYPNVLPMRRIRVRATYNSITYDVFNGYIDRWEQVYDHPSVAYAVVTATDAFKVLAAKDLPGSVYAAEVLADAPVHWWRFGDPVGTTVIGDSGSVPVAGTLTIGSGTNVPVFGSEGLIVRDPGSSVFNDGHFWFDAPATGAIGAGVTAFSVEAVIRGTLTSGVTSAYPYYQDNPSGLIDLRLAAPDTGTITFMGLTSTTLHTDLAIHHVVGVYNAGNIYLYVDGALQASGTTAVTPAAVPIQVGRTSPSSDHYLQSLAVYHSALSAPRVAAHNDAARTPWDGETSGTRVGRVLDTIDWPAADRNVDTGQSTLQATSLGGSVLSYLQKIEESESGLLWVTKDGKVRFRSRHAGFNLASQGAFGDGGGAELEYVDIAFDYSETLIYNETRVSRVDGAVQIAEDTASQVAYGARTLTSDGLLITSDAESLDRAYFLLGKYKDPVLRTTRMVVEPSGANAVDLFPQVLGREIGDKLTVRRKPQNVGASIDQAVIVEGLKHEFRDRFWSTEFMLSPSSALSTPGAGDAEYLQLNDTDGPGLGFVRLAY